jgi:hypothetical protein
LCDEPVSILGPVVGSCENDDKPSVSIKGREFLYQLSSYQLVKKDQELLYFQLARQTSTNIQTGIKTFYLPPIL